MTRTVDYIDHPPFREEVTRAPADADWSEILEPGDLMLARSVGGVVSSLIQKTDGFFTHTLIYLGTDEKGVGWVAHAYVTGVQLWNLGRLRDNYAEGALAWARPGYGTERNFAAAEWARGLAKLPTDEMLMPYGYDDLGLSFAMLVRSMWRRARDTADEIGEAELDELFAAADDALTGRDVGDLEPGTCSAFVWRAYHEGAGRSIVPELIDGLRVEDGLLKDPSTSTERSPTLTAIADRLSSKWGTLSLMAAAFPGAAALFDPDKGALLSEAVSPGDLWCSPSMVKRGRLI